MGDTEGPAEGGGGPGVCEWWCALIVSFSRMYVFVVVEFVLLNWFCWCLHFMFIFCR